MSPFSFSDIFCGIGGLRLAGQAAGGRCVFSSEIGQDAGEAHAVNHGELPAGDLAAVDPLDVPEHDLCLASPPCQPFSQAGLGGGLADGRADVLYSLFRFLARRRPRAVLVENVPALVTNRDGRAFRHLRQMLGVLGYRVSWAVLPATRFGASQLRRRLYVAGSLGRRFRFDLLPSRAAGRLADVLEPGVPDGWLSPDEYALLDQPTRNRWGMVFVGYRLKPMRYPGRDVRRPSNHRQQNRIWAAEGVGPTVSSQDVTGRYWVRTGDLVRKLTTRELARLQGLPDTFRFPRPGRAVALIGNSVHVPTLSLIIQGIAEQLLDGARSPRQEVRP